LLTFGKSRFCITLIYLALGGLFFCLLLQTGCGKNTAALSNNTQTITDMSGRQVTVPAAINRVICSNPIGTVDLYMLAPEKLVGWNFIPQGKARDFIEPVYLELPPLGVWMGAGNTPNQEEIAQIAPDVILCFWSNDDAGRHMADTIQEQTGIPVLLMDYSITAVPQVFRLLGEYLAVTERGEELAVASERILSLLEQSVKEIPPEQRKSIFIAQGNHGLQTDPVGSLHVQDALDLLAITNTANLPGTGGQGMGMPSVAPEQLLIWQPDAILVSEYNMGGDALSNIYHEILTSKSWSNLKAVENREVYRIPQLPFSWFGKPPSAARLLGCLWLLDTLYPDYTQLNLTQETADFYDLFFRQQLSAEQINALLTP